MINRAEAYAKTGETVDTVRNAATSDCRTIRVDVQMTFLENAMDDEKKSGNYDGKTSGAVLGNLDALDKKLLEDIAATVLHQRVR